MEGDGLGRQNNNCGEIDMVVRPTKPVRLGFNKVFFMASRWEAGDAAFH